MQVKLALCQMATSADKVENIAAAKSAIQVGHSCMPGPRYHDVQDQGSATSSHTFLHTVSTGLRHK